MRSHLRKEKELNKTPYGLRVLTTGQRRVTDSSTKRGAKYVTAKTNVLKDLDGFYSRTSKVKQRTKYARRDRTDGFKLEKSFAADKRPVGETNQKADAGISLELRKKVRGSMLKGFTESDRREGDFKATRQKKPTRASAAPKDDKKNQILNSRKETSDSSSTRVTQAKLPHTNCPSLDPKFMFNSIWMGSDSDWTTLQIYLGMLPDVALRQAKKGLEHYRTGLRDLWNIHGLTAGSGHGLDGQPWCTSHYSFHMVLWHIPFAVSGQQYSAVERTLHFEPKMKVPYVLPFFTPFASGLLESGTRRGKVLHKVTVMSGKLELKSLTVSQSRCPSKYQLSLKKDDYVEWTTRD